MLSYVFVVVVVLWIIAHLKTSRPDGILVSKLHPFRRLMAYIMPTRNESVVYFDQYINADELLSYLEEAKKKFNVDVTHCLVAAAGIIMFKNPKMNRFISGLRLYQRKHVTVTFSMKRKKLNKEAKLTAVKLEISKDSTFRQLCDDIQRKITYERKDVSTSTDKELSLFNSLPRPLLKFAINIARTLDYFNLLPASFIKLDGMFTSMFIANLGSVGMHAGYHHLYEWGNCSSFTMASKIYDRPVFKDGKYVPQKTLHLRFTYDERIEDGHNANDGIQTFVSVLENPYKYLGCLKEDKTDHVTFEQSLS